MLIFTKSWLKMNVQVHDAIKCLFRNLKAHTDGYLRKQLRSDTLRKVNFPKRNFLQTFSFNFFHLFCKKRFLQKILQKMLEDFSNKKTSIILIFSNFILFLHFYIQSNTLHWKCSSSHSSSLNCSGATCSYDSNWTGSRSGQICLFLEKW